MLDTMKRKETAFVSGVLVFGAAFIAWDVVVDLNTGSSLYHVWGEILTMGALIGTSLFLLRRFLQMKEANVKFQLEIGQARKDLESYKSETAQLAKDLNEKVHAQMLKWNLSKAEQDICWMVLKGLANKEVAHLRQTSEKTVTQQLGQIYAKSGLQGRSELLAFFLEDLFVEPQK
jgi:DNA-binding CsgD family transcriptional regulator